MIVPSLVRMTELALTDRSQNVKIPVWPAGTRRSSTSPLGTLTSPNGPDFAPADPSCTAFVPPGTGAFTPVSGARTNVDWFLYVYVTGSPSPPAFAKRRQSVASNGFWFASHVASFHPWSGSLTIRPLGCAGSCGMSANFPRKGAVTLVGSPKKYPASGGVLSFLQFAPMRAVSATIC